MNVLIFDIETVPDVVSARRMYGLDGLSDVDTAKALFALRRAKVGHDFLPHYLHQIVAISLVLKQGSQLKVWSLGEEDANEAELITRFFAGLDKLTPTLVSWNGGGFDLPVLHYRTLYHQLQAPIYWETGEQQPSFRWNNYLNRFHYRHLDLMDVLAGYQNKAIAPLDDIASLLGFPGKMGINGAHVWDEYCNNNIKGIRDYCETDVLNTYGVYLRFELMRGTISKNEHQNAIDTLKTYLHTEGQKNRPHLTEFLSKMESHQ